MHRKDVEKMKNVHIFKSAVIVTALSMSICMVGCGSQEAEPVMSEPVEETVEKAVEETPETEEEAEIATTTSENEDSDKEWDISDEYEEEYPDGLYEEPSTDDETYYTAYLTPEQIASERQLAQDMYDEGELDKAEYDAWIWELDHPGQEYPKQNNNTTSQAQSSQQTTYGIEHELPSEGDPFKDVEDGSGVNVTFN